MNLACIALRRLVVSFLASSAMLAAQAPAAPGAPAPTSETAVLVKQAQQLNSEGKQDEALSTYRKGLEISPNDVDAHLGMGSVFECNMGEAGRLQQVFDARMARQDFLSAADVANETARLYLECGDTSTPQIRVL